MINSTVSSEIEDKMPLWLLMSSHTMSMGFISLLFAIILGLSDHVWFKVLDGIQQTVMYIYNLSN